MRRSRAEYAIAKKKMKANRNRMRFPSPLPQQTLPPVEYGWIPAVIFGMTFFAAIIHYVHGYLIEDLHKQTHETASMSDKGGNDMSAHLNLIKFIGNIKKMFVKRHLH